MKIHPCDNVEVREDGHKYALCPLAPGDSVIKYGMPIGTATRRIAPGEHVHTQNLRTALEGRQDYEYHPSFQSPEIRCTRTFQGYRRPDGQVGIRKDLWVIPTVGCVNGLARRLAREVGGIPLCHPYGCSQLGDDHRRTADLLAALVHHPNAGGVLVVSLGCENNTLESFQERLGDVAGLNVRFLRAQDPGDEVQRGRELLRELAQGCASWKREEIPVSLLKVGLKCGGSDGFSGIVANPLVGRFSDWLVRQGGTAVLTEVPEMFGAETLLMDRCATREIFDQYVEMINGFKDYYQRHGQPCYENPSPGNKAGGITTLEEKSLGCVQKGGGTPVMAVLPYASRATVPGLNVLCAPGNDMVSATALAAAGCHLLLFTTGRGTPLGSVVPTVKIASNHRLALNKPTWIDFDAQDCQGEESALVETVLQVASGTTTRNEEAQEQEIAIFKDGVTL
ncbi:MAG: UxaA family hydrolase [Oligosphaeraceae bacterium]